MNWVIEELRYKAKLFEDIGAVTVDTGLKLSETFIAILLFAKSFFILTTVLIFILLAVL